MRKLWIAMLGVGMMVPVGAVAQVSKTQAQPGHTTMCRADRKALRKTQKAEEKAARDNEKAAQEQVKAEGRQKKTGGQMKALAVALTPPPM